ncbi:alpha-ketoglutarate decarboxylase [Maribacter sp. 2307ULW6-5]|uniref:alpha-ketoglutarate decarboxylase n=1 Tax=Maribacter sp. 2307ULW6-5 TaxID=3386275 RepID=UPI0039BCA6EA
MILKKTLTLVLCCLGLALLQAQNPLSQDNFWDRVRYGGGFGLGFTNGGFNGTLAPSAIYEFNKYVAAGAGLNLSYAKFNDNSFLAYGGSFMTLVHPIPQIQISAEFEQLRINRTLRASPNNIEDNYWLPALFVGAGWRSRNVTFGVRYDLLFDEGRSIYANNLMPFVRFFF